MVYSRSIRRGIRFKVFELYATLATTQTLIAEDSTTHHGRYLIDGVVSQGKEISIRETPVGFPYLGRSILQR